MSAVSCATLLHALERGEMLTDHRAGHATCIPSCRSAGLRFQCPSCAVHHYAGLLGQPQCSRRLDARRGCKERMVALIVIEVWRGSCAAGRLTAGGCVVNFAAIAP